MTIEPGAYTDLASLIRMKHQAQGFSFLPRQPIHSLLSGQKASRLRGRGLNFEEIRTYLPGDDTRNIDWKVTARLREPHVRVYTEERDRPAIFVIDQRIAMFFGSKKSMKSVTAAEASAIGAWRVLDQGDRVGGIVFNDETISEIRPNRSSKSVMRLLKTVVEFNQALSFKGKPKSVPGQLNAALEQASRLVSHDALVCVISDMNGADVKTKELLTRLARHNDVIVAFVFDPLEAELPEAGRLVAGDGEMQLEINSGDAALQKSFKAEFAKRTETVKSILLKRDVAVLPLDTVHPVVSQVSSLLGQRPQRRR